MIRHDLRRLLKTDLYDGAPWTEGDLLDLKAAVERGRNLEDIAELLCRSGSTSDVRSKAAELGLNVLK